MDNWNQNNQYYNQMNNPQNMYYVPDNQMEQGRKLLGLSTIIGIISAVLLLIGLLMPAIDFSHFHEQVDIQYNLLKICKNVGLISSMWIGIPYGIIIGIIMMFILSFVKIPQLKLIPCILVVAMFVLMLVDVGNVIEWINGILNKYPVDNMKSVNMMEIFKSMMAGIYIMASGIIVGIVSCFVKA